MGREALLTLCISVVILLGVANVPSPARAEVRNGVTGFLLLADDQADRLLGDDRVIGDLALVELVDLRAEGVEAAVEI